MKLTQVIKENPYFGVIIVVVALVIVCSALLLSGLLQTGENQKNGEVIENMIHQQLPEAIITELDQIKQKNSFTVTRGEIDEQQKSITLHEIYMDEDQINELQGKKIDG